MTMAPRPMLMSEKPWYWDSRPPASATRPLETIRPSTMVTFVLMPWARAMCWFAPVARSEQPSSVPKNQYSTPIRAAQKMSSTKIGLLSASART